MSGLVTTGLGFLSRLCCCSGEVKVTVSPSPSRLIPDTLRYSANNFSSTSVNSQFNFDKRCWLASVPPFCSGDRAPICVVKPPPSQLQAPPSPSSTSSLRVLTRRTPIQRLLLCGLRQ